eukprot:5238780-Pleurochrysis_carterae.AAC.1
MLLNATRIHRLYGSTAFTGAVSSVKILQMYPFLGNSKLSTDWKVYRESRRGRSTFIGSNSGSSDNERGSQIVARGGKFGYWSDCSCCMHKSCWGANEPISCEDRVVVLAMYRPHQRKSVVTTEAAPFKIAATTSAKAKGVFARKVKQGGGPSMHQWTQPQPRPARRSTR